MRRISLLTIVFLLGITTIATAQGIDGFDVANLDVDRLSDEQVQQIAREIESRGLTTQQAVQAFLAQGMPRSEATKLSRRLNQADISRGQDGSSLRTSRLRSNPADTNNTDIYLPGRLLPDSIPGSAAGGNSQFARFLARQDSVFVRNQMLKERIFGFELFQDSEISFEPSLNIPTPKGYQLGTGDELLIDIYGAAQNTYQLEISPDGSVFIDNVGPVYLNGLTINEAEIKLRGKLGQIYSGLNNPENSNTFMDVSLGQIRSIKVTMLGEVTQPGTYTLPSLASVFNALYAAGGPSVNGSLRKINVIRGDSAIATFDVYDLLVNSDQSENIRLKDQDIIKISPYVSRVEIEGKVKRPGIYEVQENETLADLITFTGGFTGDAYQGRIKVIGSTDREKRINDIQKGNFDSFNLQDGDAVTVGEVLDRFENIVEIRGAVYRGGRYQLTDSSTVYNLIQRSEGLKQDAFMNRGLIYREQPDLTTEAIAFNISELMNNPAQNDVALKENDIVLIQSIFDLRENFTVRVIGPVLNPGEFEYVQGMTLEDIIFQAEGFRQSAAPYRIEVARRVRSLDQTQNEESNQVAKIFQFNVDESLKLDEEDADFTLQPFDNVYIRELPNYSQQKYFNLMWTKA